jgi:hypothetical protein
MIFCTFERSLEDTLVRKCSNKFGISLTYSYLCRRLRSPASSLTLGRVHASMTLHSLNRDLDTRNDTQEAIDTELQKHS